METVEGTNVYEDMPNADYHAEKEHMSSSGLKLFPDKVDEFIAKYCVSGVIQPEKECFKIGNAVHAAILEPHLYESDYIIEPEGLDKRKTKDKEIYKEFLEMSEDLIVLNNETANMIKNIQLTVGANELTRTHLKGAKFENSFFHYSDGVKQKVRPDILNGKMILDIKTTDNVYKFEDSIISFGYHFSAAMYTEIVSEVIGEKATYLFLAIQKKYPLHSGCIRNE